MKPALVEPGLDVIRPGMPFPEWRAQAPRLGRVYRSMGWVVADWILFGEAQYGEICWQGVYETGLEPHTIKNLLAVARAFPLSRRRDALSVSHHEAIAALPAAEQDRLLDLAEQSALSVTALRSEARGARPRPPTPAPVDEGQVIPHLEVGSLVDLAQQGRCRITYIGHGAASVLVNAVRV
jgi:hypothetical protein